MPRLGEDSVQSTAAPETMLRSTNVQVAMLSPPLVHDTAGNKMLTALYVARQPNRHFDSQLARHSMSGLQPTEAVD